MFARALQFGTQVKLLYMTLHNRLLKKFYHINMKNSVGVSQTVLVAGLPLPPK